MKHTPTPWIAEGFEQIAGNGNFYGGLIVGVDNEVIVAQCVAPCNANLIAAAPDLFDAMIDLVEAVTNAINAGDWKVDGACDPDAAIERSLRAIAKATG